MGAGCAMNVPVDPPWTGTGGLSDTQSYAWILQNGIFERLAASSFFSGFVCKRISAALPIEAGIQIPFLGVFRGPEEFEPDGGLVGTGDIGFIDRVLIGIQIVIKNNDSVAMLAKLDEASWFILNRILRDNSLTNRFKTTLPDGVQWEGCAKVQIRTDVWGTTGTKNETPVGERVLWMTWLNRPWFAPTDFPPLERIDVTTAFPFGGDDAAQEGTQQVRVVYEFTPDAVPTPLPPDPVLVSISPTTAASGIAMFLTAMGTDFDSTAQVCLDGLPQTTTFIASTELQATVPDTFLAGVYNVTVQNAAGGVTEVQVFTLT
jgi:hypothetical protein